MRIDLPGCSFKNCRYNYDCNCTKQAEYDRCDYRLAKIEATKDFVAKIETELAGYELHFTETQDWSARNTIQQVISVIKEMAGENNG